MAAAQPVLTDMPAQRSHVQRSRVTDVLRARRTRTVAAPVVMFIVVVGLWQAGVWNSLFGLQSLALPLPSAIAAAFRDNGRELAMRSGQSFEAAGIGYALGNVVGWLLGVLLTTLPSGAARRAGSVFTGIQALPVIAVAPIAAYWVSTEPWFKVIVVVIMVFPSMLIYSYRGMTSVDPDAVDLLRSYNATRWQLLRAVRLPCALPQIFTALRFTTVVTLIGVVIAEILSVLDGLGYEIDNSLQAFETARAWAAVVILAVAGILAYTLLSVIERLAFPWSNRSGHGT